MNSERSLRGRLGTYGGPVLVILWTLFPVLWILSLSFKPESGINNEKFLPDTFTLENYRTVFKSPLFTSALRNSIVFGNDGRALYFSKKLIPYLPKQALDDELSPVRLESFRRMLGSGQ